jgi:hypothetical protein
VGKSISFCVLKIHKLHLPLAFASLLCAYSRWCVSELGTLLPFTFAELRILWTK